MSVLGRPLSLLVFAMLLLLLAIAHPITFLQARHAALDGQSFVSAAALYVERYENAQAIRDAARGHESIGYVCEAPIDVRVGGPLQARYYLSQFALAPLLLELESEEAAHELVLANFQTKRELTTYLEATSRRVIVTVNDSVALTTKHEVQ